MSSLRQRPSTRPTTPPKIHQQALHSHTHSHSHSGHSHGAEETAALVSALKGGSDPGSRITLIGMGANVGLTAVKGAAGWALGSAALMADAAHSGSDLLADFVTLGTYRMSRKEANASHPYGYGKYESLGSLVVSFLLVGTALGIGMHSYHLLLTTLAALPQMNAELLASLDFLPHGHVHGGVDHDHAGGEGEHVDARAMWFAAGSVVIKEWLYRITLKVAKSEHSNVLLANAFHHRSDAFGSLVAVGAIGGAWLGYPMLDPLGGLLVSGMILKQGGSVGMTALKELVDQVTDPTLAPKVHSLLLSLRDPSLPPLPAYSTSPSGELESPPHDHSHSTSTSDLSLDPAHPSLPILAIPSIRVFSSGPSFMLDVLLVLPGRLTLEEATKVEELVIRRCTEEFGGPSRVREVVVRLKAEEVEGEGERK